MAHYTNGNLHFFKSFTIVITKWGYVKCVVEPQKAHDSQQNAIYKVFPKGLYGTFHSRISEFFYLKSF